MRKEFRRQFAHFLLGSFIISLVAVAGVLQALAAIAAIFLIGLLASYLIKKGIHLPVLFEMVERVEREHEKRLPGKAALMFFFGAIILMLFFQNQLVVIGALCVAVYGDAASTVFGLKLGKHPLINGKTFEGTLGGILVALVFLGVLFEWWIALLVAVAGMLVELLPFDDSITIPIVAAAALAVLL